LRVAGDTIVAIASPPGRGARGVVRLSGPRALELARSLVPVATAEGFRRLEAPLALPGWPPVPAALWVFVAPRSYTGEDGAELHVPGSPPLLAAIVRALESRGARAASPGEFTRRAFLSGRLDLAQAEAVLALTSAEADGEARAAARALEGGLARAIDAQKTAILDALAHVEATIDFPEEDLPGLAPAERLAAQAAAASQGLAALEGRSLGTRVARSEARVVIAGAANAGKSTLLNALAGREAAIVSPEAGTTRDPVSARIDVGGVSVSVLDTAGEKVAAGAIEREALALSRELVATADLVVWVADASREAASDLRLRLSALAPRASLLVGNKVDLAPAPAGFDLLVSATTGRGLPALRDAIARALEREGLATDLVQTERQSRLVARARDALDRAAALLRSAEPARLELAACDLRLALGALGELTGAVATDDVLDRIFGEFCVGK
jgi:tRNA modification GTPase